MCMLHKASRMQHKASNLVFSELVPEVQTCPWLRRTECRFASSGDGTLSSSNVDRCGPQLQPHEGRHGGATFN